VQIDCVEIAEFIIKHKRSDINSSVVSADDVTNFLHRCRVVTHCDRPPFMNIGAGAIGVIHKNDLAEFFAPVLFQCLNGMDQGHE
jgi:hypothetical protein